MSHSIAAARIAARRYWRRRWRRSRHPLGSRRRARSARRPRSQDTLGAGQFLALHPYGLAQAAADSFETGFDHMMRILAVYAQMQCRSQRLGQRSKEMRNEFGGQIADSFAVEASLPDEIRPAGQIHRNLGLGFVHREQKAIARDAAFVAQGLAQRGSQRERAVLDGVVFIDMQIAAAGQGQCESAMPRKLLQHMIEESQAGGHADGSLTRQIQLDRDIRFLGGTPHPGMTSRAQYALRDCRPRFLFGTGRAHPQALYPEIGGKFEIGIPVADHVAVRLVHGIGLDIILDHAGLRFAAGAVLALEVRTDENGVEFYALRGEQRQDELVRRVELFAGQAGCAESILIGDHHEGEARALQVQQCREDARHQPDLFQAVHLFVGRFFVESAVAVQEHYARARHAAATLASSASFCARVPTEIRSEFGSAGLPRRSRTIKPPAMLERMNRSGSRQSMSRKFASLGHTFSTHGEDSRPCRRYSRSASSACTRSPEAASSPGRNARNAASMAGCDRE